LYTVGGGPTVPAGIVEGDAVAESMFDTEDHRDPGRHAK
jgi:hypothetical protein